MDLFWCWLTSNFNSTTPLKRKRPILNICERSHDGVGFALFGRNGGTEINRGICLDVFFKHVFSVSNWNPQEFTGFQVSSVGIIFHIMTNRSSETFDQDIRDLEKVVSFYWDSSLGLVSFFFFQIHDVGVKPKQLKIEVCISWIYPPSNNSHHQDYYVFSTCREPLSSFKQLPLWTSVLAGPKL